MRAEILDIVHKVAEGLKNTKRLAERRNICAREDPLTDPGAELAVLSAADEVKQPPALIADGSMDHGSECRVVLRSHVLQHSHGHENIELAGHVSIIVFDELDPVIQVLFVNASLRTTNLLMGNIERFHMDTVIARHMEGQRSPTAAGLDNRFSWLEPQLPASIVQLCGLSFFESRRS